MKSIEFAIKMENDGEKYYRRQAGINSANNLYTVCMILAEEEKKHALLLADLKNNTAEVPGEKDPLSRLKSIFKNLENFKSEINELPTQLEFYTMAQEKEKESIELYQNFLSGAKSETEKKLFEYLIGQEKRHYEILEELIVRLSHAEDWVESAEFGLWSNRGEY